MRPVPLLLAASVTLFAGRLPAQAARAQGTVESPVVEVHGMGELRLPPDVAVLRIEVAARASTAAAAAAETGRRLAAVADTLRRSGLGPEIVQPLALSVGSNEARSEGRLVDYEARAAISVRIRHLDRLGLLVDAALAAGATEIPSVRFESDSMAAAARNALAKAYADALGTARALAAAAGARLGPVIGIEVWDRPEDWMSDEDLEYLGPRSGTSARRDVRVAASVTVRWQLVQGPR
jgi:uncharacterized protein